MWLIYLISILDSLCVILIIATVITGIVYTIGFVGHLIESTDTYSKDEGIMEMFATLKRTFGITFLILLPLAVFTPTSKQAATIFSIGKTIEYVQGNEKIKELPDTAIECLDKYLKEYLAEKEEK